MKNINEQPIWVWKSLAWMAILVAGLCMVWAIFVVGANAQAVVTSPITINK
jgi:Mg2+ and Co2+ transporter CorA